MRLNTSRSDWHRHTFEISPTGDGSTSLDMNHRHDIKNYIVLEDSGHQHILLGVCRVLQNQGSLTRSEGKMFTTHSVMEKSTNMYGEVPKPREPGAHRRVEAIKRSKIWSGTSLPEHFKKAEELRLAAVRAINDGYGLPLPRFAGGDKRAQEIEDIEDDRTSGKPAFRSDSISTPVVADPRIKNTKKNEFGIPDDKEEDPVVLTQK